MSTGPDTNGCSTNRQPLPAVLPWAVALGAGLLWAYWPTLAIMARKWQADPQYSHGYVVPAFALVLLWRRRGLLLDRPAPSPRGRLWGVCSLLLAIDLRLTSALLYIDWLDAISLLPCLSGLALLLGGWAVFRWCWPAVAFLVFMIPLPFQVEVALAHPLQRIAATSSAYLLQVLGFTVASEGNIILLGNTRVGVAEACSGLSMLLIFFALAFALVTVIARPLWQKAVLVVAAVPIAVVSNVFRITLTGVLYETAGGGVADVFYHDLAGWVMMPVALALFWGLVRYLDHLWIAPASPAPFGPPLPEPKRKLNPILGRRPQRPGAVRWRTSA